MACRHLILIVYELMYTDFSCAQLLDSDIYNGKNELSRSAALHFWSEWHNYLLHLVNTVN